jgi:hypothetical protein
MVLLHDVGPMEARFGPFETVLILTQDRYTIWAKRAIGSEIVFGAPVETPRCRGSNERSFWSVWR